MKVCRTCGEAKALTEFYRHANCPDGHKAHCKKCVLKKQSDQNKAHPEIRKARREQQREQIRAYGREHNKTEAHKLSAKKHRSTPEYRAKAAERLREYRKTNKLKTWARNQFTNAKVHGRIVPQPCENCGDPKSEAHHDDYTKPLDVRWLCRLCHMRHHDHGFKTSDISLLRRQAE